MKKLISFRTFKKYCAFTTGNRGSGNKCLEIFWQEWNNKCCQKNCPAWKRLKEPKPIVIGHFLSKEEMKL